MVELADALDSKSSGSDTIPVRPRSAAPKMQPFAASFFIFKDIKHPNNIIRISAVDVKVYQLLFLGKIRKL